MIWDLFLVLAFALIMVIKYNFCVVQFNYYHNLKIKLYIECGEVVFWQIFKRVLIQIFISVFSFWIVVLVIKLIIKYSIILLLISIMKITLIFRFIFIIFFEVDKCIFIANIIKILLKGYYELRVINYIDNCFIFTITMAFHLKVFWSVGETSHFDLLNSIYSDHQEKIIKDWQPNT